MSVFLDASVLVSFVVNDAMTGRAERLLASPSATFIVSDFVVAEVSSAINRRVRIGRLSARDARATFDDLDAWLARTIARVAVTPDDVAAATAYIRRLDLNLRAPDAINIAMAFRLDAELATFDERMALGARALNAKLHDLPA